MKLLASLVCAKFYFFITLGRMNGPAFILRRPSNLRISKGNRVDIGRNVMIDKDARIIARGGNISIGDDVFIGKNSTIIAFSNLRIGARTLIGQNCSLHTENHGPQGNRSTYSSNPIVIESDVWLGAGVVVTSGCKLGVGVTVGANSVVTKDLEAGFLYVGAPARPIGQV